MTIFIANPAYTRHRQTTFRYDLEEPPIAPAKNGYITTVQRRDAALARAAAEAEQRNKPITVWQNAEVVGVMHP